MYGSRSLIWCASTETYAVPASYRDGSMFDIAANLGAPLGVTFVHVFPSSRVSCTRPSIVPAQMAPLARGDSAMAKTTIELSTYRLSGTRPPLERCLVVSFVVRSGLMTSQLWPPFRVRCMYWLPTYTML